MKAKLFLNFRVLAVLVFVGCASSPAMVFDSTVPKEQSAELQLDYKLWITGIDGKAVQWREVHKAIIPAGEHEFTLNFRGQPFGLGRDDLVVKSNLPLTATLEAGKKYRIFPGASSEFAYREDWPVKIEEIQ
jgi:hypothetical protein